MRDISCSYVHRIHIQEVESLRLDEATNVQYNKDGKLYNLDNVEDLQLSQISDITLYKANNVKIDGAHIIDIIQTQKLNDISIGIEMTNPGDVPFAIEQTRALARLCGKILLDYNISVFDMIGHADIAPNRKQDPSGYFSWKSLYEQIHHDISSKLSSGEITNVGRVNSLCRDLKKLIDVMEIQSTRSDTIILKPGIKASDHIKCLQRNLRKYGYGYVEVNGRYDENLMNTIVSFNRHFCPEIFIKEKTIEGRTVIDRRNKYWYELSELRLASLVTNLTN